MGEYDNPGTDFLVFSASEAEAQIVYPDGET